MASRWDPPFWIGDREFTAADLELVYETSKRFSRLSRWELALTICENLGWEAPNGRPRAHSCLVLLEQLAAAGLVVLPAKARQAAHRPRAARAQVLPPVAIVARLADVRPVTVVPVPADEQPQWDATMAAEHAQGFRRAFGAHQRYWIYGQFEGQPVILGGLLFAAAARHVACRDVWLGWSPLQRKRFRYRVVANSRFLIRAGVQVPHLASHALALALRRLPQDWRDRFGYEPVVVETFVRTPWRGTCYRVANWVHLGQTTGTGRQDRRYREPGSVKEVFAYPLIADFRQALVAESRTPPVVAKEGHTVPAGLPLPDELAAEHIRQRFELLSPWLNEKQRRLLAAVEAKLVGPERVGQVAALVHMAPSSIRAGLRELAEPASIEPERVRRPGGGRKPLTETDPTLRNALEQLVSPATCGNPESPLCWTNKSTRELAAALQAQGHAASHATVAKLLHEMGYSLQANRKLREGKLPVAARDAQFRRINADVQDYQRRGQPVISIDTVTWHIHCPRPHPWLAGDGPSLPASSSGAHRDGVLYCCTAEGGRPMPAKTVQLRSVTLFLGDEWWALQKRHVTDVAAEVVLRVRVGDAPERDVVVHVPPIDVQQLAEAQGLDRNTAAMVLALARVEDAVADKESLEPVPSVLLVQPDPSGRPSVSRDVIARARKLLAWEPVQPGEVYQPAR